jgi:hypothetical protein
MFWMMNDMPTAVIRTARRGADRSLRYATRSTLAFTAAPNAIAIRKVAPRPRTIAPALLVSLRLKVETISELATRPVSAKMSPWAKLISCRIP